MRKNKRGYRASVTSGYGSPRAVRGLHPSGLQGIVVHTQEELVALTPKTQGAIIAHVGLKRKVELLGIAMEKKIPVLNVKDVAAFLKKTETERKQRKEAHENKRQEKEKKQDQFKKTAKEAEKKEDAEAVNEEDKKKEQVKEMEKILTKRE